MIRVDIMTVNWNIGGQPGDEWFFSYISIIHNDVVLKPGVWGLDLLFIDSNLISGFK